MQDKSGLLKIKSIPTPHNDNDHDNDSTRVQVLYRGIVVDKIGIIIFLETFYPLANSDGQKSGKFTILIKEFLRIKCPQKIIYFALDIPE